MYGSEEAGKIIDELEILEAERRQFHERGSHFRIFHRYRDPHFPCGANEEVAAVYLIHVGRAFQVGLGTILSMLFDFLARHNRLAQTARQIERGAGIPRRYVRIYMERIRAAIAKALREAGLDIQLDAVLASEDTATNETGYRLRGTFEWLHIKE
jgi:hypothetical protein